MQTLIRNAHFHEAGGGHDGAFRKQGANAAGCLGIFRHHIEEATAAGAMAKQNELYVLDMGKPVKILDLAENMIRLSGFTPYKDIDIVEIGLRPGEKLYEELLMKTEELDKTSNDMIFIERDKGLPRAEVERKLELVRAAIETEEQSAVLDVIRKTVPTFRDPEEVNRRADQAQEVRQAAAANQ